MARESGERRRRAAAGGAARIQREIWARGRGRAPRANAGARRRGPGRERADSRAGAIPRRAGGGGEKRDDGRVEKARSLSHPLPPKKTPSRGRSPRRGALARALDPDPARDPHGDRANPSLGGARGARRAAQGRRGREGRALSREREGHPLPLPQKRREGKREPTCAETRTADLRAGRRAGTATTERVTALAASACLLQRAIACALVLGEGRGSKRASLEDEGGEGSSCAGRSKRLTSCVCVSTLSWARLCVRSGWGRMKGARRSSRTRQIWWARLSPSLLPLPLSPPLLLSARGSMVDARARARFFSDHRHQRAGLVVSGSSDAAREERHRKIAACEGGGGKRRLGAQRPAAAAAGPQTHTFATSPHTHTIPETQQQRRSRSCPPTVPATIPRFRPAAAGATAARPSCASLLPLLVRKPAPQRTTTKRAPWPAAAPPWPRP